MRNKSAIVFILACLHSFVLISCNNSATTNTEEQQPLNKIATQAHYPDTFKTAVMHEKLSTPLDVLNTFSLYLPADYTDQKQWPIVFFFDPSGKGQLPIIKYKGLSDSLGIIFIGSNTFKNGLQFDEINGIWNTLKNYALNTFSIDKNQLYVAGFSGGARAACQLASIDNSIKGVLALSAAAPNLKDALKNNTIFIGIAGNGDMNRAEMLGVEQSFFGSSLTHYYMEFNGIHEWCPHATMKAALQLLQIEACKINPSLLKPQLIEQFANEQNKQIQNDSINNDLIAAYNKSLLLKNALIGLHSTLEVNPDEIGKLDEYRIQKQELIHITIIETNWQQELYQLITSNSPQVQWKIKIDKLRKGAKKNDAQAAMCKRVIGYAGLLCYSISNRLLVSRMYDKAADAVWCYAYTEEKNSEVYYFKAVIAGSKPDKDAVIDNLKKAISLGFTSKERILQQAEFTFIKNDPIFSNLL